MQKRKKYLHINHRGCQLPLYLKFDIVPIYLSSHYFWIVPKCHQKPVWKIFIFHFDFVIWVFIFSSLLVTSCIWNILDKKGVTLSVMLNYQLLLESTNFKSIKIQNISSRILVGSSMIGFFILSIIFKSVMLHSLTTVASKCPFNHPDDIFKNNLKCYLTKTQMNLYQSKNDPLAKYVSKCELIDLSNDHQEIFKEIAFNQNAAVISRELKFKYGANIFYHMGFKETPIYLLKKYQVKFDFLYIYFSKGYPMYESFLRLFQRMHSAGFYDRFRVEAYRRVNKDLKKREKIVSKNITFEQMSIAFYILLLGLSISFVVFLKEIIIRN